MLCQKGPSCFPNEPFDVPVSIFRSGDVVEQASLEHSSTGVGFKELTHPTAKRRQASALQKTVLCELEILLRAFDAEEVGIPEEVHFFHGGEGLGAHDAEADVLGVGVIPD